MSVIRLSFLVALPLVVIGLFTAATYAARARRRQACDDAIRLGLVNALWAFLTECAATLAVSALVPVGWCMPRWRFAGDLRGSVILVHGWGVNRGALWLLRRRLLRAGWGSVWCFGYRAYRPDVEHPAALLHQMVLEAARVSRAPITLVGHGFGGLVLRYHARRYPPSGIRRIVTLGTPHQGTDLARWHPMLRRHLTPGAALLNRLNANDRVPQQFDVIAISSTFDARILPAANAEYPEAFNVKVADVGHNALLFSKKIVHLICENLDVPAVAGSVAPRTGLAPKISP